MTFLTSWRIEEGRVTYVLPSKDDGSGVPDILMMSLSIDDLKTRMSSSSKLGRVEELEREMVR